MLCLMHYLCQKRLNFLSVYGQNSPKSLFFTLEYVFVHTRMISGISISLNILRLF